VQEGNDISLANALLGWYLDNIDGDGGFVISDTLLCRISALGRSKGNKPK
jgi:hypothetical protein